jgi:hypothetical protein
MSADDQSAFGGGRPVVFGRGVDILVGPCAMVFRRHQPFALSRFIGARGPPPSAGTPGIVGLRGLARWKLVTRRDEKGPRFRGR